MEPSIDYGKRVPELRQAMWALEHYVDHSDLDPKLLELVKLRASLINGCAYCVDMHTKVARSLGETEQRLYEVSLWREAPFYPERERAALAFRTVPGTFQIRTPAPGDREAYATSSGQPRRAGR